MTFEIRVDCPACRVEGARIETWDNEHASCRLGIASLTRCNLCRQSTEGRVEGVDRVFPGEGCPGCGANLDDKIRDAHRCPHCGKRATTVETEGSWTIGDEAELEGALEVWAKREGLPTATMLLEAYFVEASTTDVFDKMKRGERIETTFDVADYLFSSGGAAGGGGEAAVMREEEEAPSTQRMNQPKSIRKVGGAREEMLALASVAAADGEASEDDLIVLQRAATKRNVPPVAPEDIRVWRPNELDPPPTLVDRERVLEEMLQMAWSDGQLDPSELRVVRDFARAWGIDPERLKEWLEVYSFADANVFERWFRRIGFFLFPGK